MSHQIVQILKSKVIPWTAQTTNNHFVVARPIMRQRDLPNGVTLSPQPIKGKRIVMRNNRIHANQRLRVAEWPEANLHEISLPKLACVVDGDADYLLGKYSVHCGEGSFILMPPHSPHQCTGPFLSKARQKNNSCSLLHAYAYSHGILLWLSRSCNDQHINDFTQNYLITNTPAGLIFNLMMEEAIEAKAGFESTCNGLLTAFFSLMAREIEEGHYTQSSPKTNDLVSVISDGNFPEQIKTYLTSNCYKPLKLSDVAAHFYMSTAQLTRRVRNETGDTFVELLTAARIEHAKELLCETDWTFTVIASYCSFKSASYFLQLFHQRVGCTPMEYRRQNNEQKR